MSKTTTHTDNDLALWRLFLQGDEDAFETIFRGHNDMLYRYGSAITPHSEVVEDSIQDIFIELWNSRTRLKETDSIRFYLFKVLRRKIYRNLDLRVDLRDDFSNLIVGNEASPEGVIIDDESQTERLKRLSDAILLLPPRQREVIELRFYHGFGYEQIAELTDINLQSVHNNMHRALTSLRQRLPSDLFMLLMSFVPPHFTA
jgi:RNA polymerase sigma factor (sigma-70 family)